VADTYKLPNGDSVIGAWFGADYRGDPLLWILVSERRRYRIEGLGIDEIPAPLMAMAKGAMHLTQHIIAHAGKALAEREAADG
jgi:hypothetical protein